MCQKRHGVLLWWKKESQCLQFCLLFLSGDPGTVFLWCSLFDLRWVCHLKTVLLFSSWLNCILDHRRSCWVHFTNFPCIPVNYATNSSLLVSNLSSCLAFTTPRLIPRFLCLLLLLHVNTVHSQLCAAELTCVVTRRPTRFLQILNNRFQFEPRHITYA